jgi:hypothetical protein
MMDFKTEALHGSSELHQENVRCPQGNKWLKNGTISPLRFQSKDMRNYANSEALSIRFMSREMTSDRCLPSRSLAGKHFASIG